jgi:hypothetical protein
VHPDLVKLLASKRYLVTALPHQSAMCRDNKRRQRAGAAENKEVTAKDVVPAPTGTNMEVPSHSPSRKICGVKGTRLCVLLLSGVSELR